MYGTNRYTIYTEQQRLTGYRTPRCFAAARHLLQQWRTAPEGQQGNPTMDLDDLSYYSSSLRIVILKTYGTVSQIR